MKRAIIPQNRWYLLSLTVFSLLVSSCNKMEQPTIASTEEPATPSVSLASVAEETYESPEIATLTPLPTILPSSTPALDSNVKEEMDNTSAPTKTLMPSPVHSPTPFSVNVEPLQDIWPLEVGTYWVSISTNIDFGLSATYLVTDTVKNIIKVENLYVVEMHRQQELVYGDESVEFATTLQPGDYFYIVSEVENYVNVYWQRRLDLSTLDSSELVFVFPLELDGCWITNQDLEYYDSCNAYVREVDDFFPLDSGQLMKCFSIWVFTLVGRGHVTFCPGIGIAGRDFLLNSNPPTISAGYNEILIDYSFRTGFK
ncbi:MAG: hypothetical protein IT327_12175 [Anaerolineae bacterium]|nr:hypothetical protein [Anaerolineae bacterium]